MRMVNSKIIFAPHIANGFSLILEEAANHWKKRSLFKLKLHKTKVKPLK